MAEAHARLGQTDQELAVYGTVLQELSAKADHMPLGEAVAKAPRHEQGEKPAETRTARSPEYARVLDLYLAPPGRPSSACPTPSPSTATNCAATRPTLASMNASPPSSSRTSWATEVEAVYQQAIGQFKNVPGMNDLRAGIYGARAPRTSPRLSAR